MTTKKVRKTSPKVNILTIQRVFDATPKTLWSYWTDPKKFARWFNPAPGFDLVVHEYEVREGGHVRFDMPQPGGNANPQEGVFHSLKPYRELASGSPDKSFLIVVRFARAGKRTRMTVTVTGVPPQYREGARKGWTAGFDKLSGLLALGLTSKGFTIERTFPVPVERMWALWTTKEGIESWWGPEGFATTVRSMELRAGGAIEYEMTATGAEPAKALAEMGMPRSTQTRNVYAEVITHRRLLLRTRVDFVPGAAPYDLHMAIDFRPRRGGTKVIVTSEKMHDPRFQELARQGESEQFDKLSRLVARGAPVGAPTVRTTMDLRGDREVLISHVFDAPRERVFTAFTDPAAIVAWWGPKGYTTRVDTLDARPGGKWRFVQHDLEGREHGFHGEYLEVVPPQRIAQTFEYEGAPGHVIEETATFTALQGGRTKLTLTARFANRADRDAMIDTGMEWGMRESYERLDDLLAQGE